MICIWNGIDTKCLMEHGRQGKTYKLLKMTHGPFDLLLILCHIHSSDDRKAFALTYVAGTKCSRGLVFYSITQKGNSFILFQAWPALRDIFAAPILYL